VTSAAGATSSSLGAASRAARWTRALASPVGVLVIVPLLVVLAAVAVMWLGRRATVEGSDAMARRQLGLQAAAVQHDVAFALDQAGPMLERLRGLADQGLPLEAVAVRLHDLHLGRPGVSNLSVAFPDGEMRGSFYAEGTPREMQIQDNVHGPAGTDRIHYRIAAAGLVEVDRQRSDYDVRTRPQYALAVAARARTWTPPKVFFTAHTTGLNCTEPRYGPDGALRAVLSVGFDVDALSAFIATPPLAGARTVVFTADGTILAFPSQPVPAAATASGRLLKHEDYADPALEALFAAGGNDARAIARLTSLHTADGDYLVAVTAIGGARAGVAAPLDWYMATLLPERSLLGPTRRLQRESLIASGGVVLVAIGVALLFAWNLVRMRRAVGVARDRARSAEARARALGSYQLLERLGAGGMGEVWRAEHRLLARQAAVKLVRPDALADPLHAPKALERFRREAQTLAAMRSRHTIALFDYGVTEDGTFYYVMELLDGIDLERLILEHGAQPPARVIAMLAQACASLGEAHEAGLLHRDIKPANLVLSRAATEVDIVKVLDFGIVRTAAEVAPDPIDVVALPAPRAAVAAEVAEPASRLTRADALIGTPGFIAPEQALGAAIDARADLYALGCVA
jgi:tRNA A-37 threonylcarbamoyl transferase component Bud32